jgi:hypothetical protein
LLNTGDILTMEYKPKNGIKKIYEGAVGNDGSISLLGQSYSSPSYAALAGIQDAGSDRKTVNGWTSWRDRKGCLIAELREKYLNQQYLIQ